MKKVFSILIVLGCFPVWAEVTPADVDSMLNQMVTEKVISADEAARAKVRLKGMSADQWAQIKTAGENAAARMPASAATTSNNKIEEVHGIDLDGAQFKAIQNDLRKIIPQAQD